MALLASWGKRFFEHNNGDSKKIISDKYEVGSPNILLAKDARGSTFWKSITSALNASGVFYKWKLGNGVNINFWHGTWVGDCSLKVQFWDLFEICNQVDSSVAEVWDGRNLKLSFRRCVDHEGMVRWGQLVALVRTYPIKTEPDTPIWTLVSNGVYSVKSFYSKINFGGVVPLVGGENSMST